MLTALLIATCAASLTGDGKADVPYRARLLAQADLAPPPLPPPAGVDRAALQAERTRILETQPGLGFPITMISIGTGVSLLSFLMVASVASSYYGFSEVGIAVVSVLIAGAVGMVVIGVISLVGRLGERRASAPRLKAIEDQLGPARPDDQLAPPPPGPPPPPPGPDQPPGPPPPPPPPLALLTF